MSPWETFYIQTMPKKIQHMISHYYRIFSSMKEELKYWCNMDITFQLKHSNRGWQVAQLVTCLICKYEDLGSIPRSYLWQVRCTCDVCTEEMEAGRFFSVLASKSTLLCKLWTNGRPCLKNKVDGFWRITPRGDLWPLHICKDIYTHPHVQTHACMQNHVLQYKS